MFSNTKLILFKLSLLTFLLLNCFSFFGNSNVKPLETNDDNYGEISATPIVQTNDYISFNVFSTEPTGKITLTRFDSENSDEGEVYFTSNERSDETNANGYYQYNIVVTKQEIADNSINGVDSPIEDFSFSEDYWYVEEFLPTTETNDSITIANERHKLDSIEEFNPLPMNEINIVDVTDYGFTFEATYYYDGTNYGDTYFTFNYLKPDGGEETLFVPDKLNTYDFDHGIASEEIVMSTDDEPMETLTDFHFIFRNTSETFGDIEIPEMTVLPFFYINNTFEMINYDSNNITFEMLIDSSYKLDPVQEEIEFYALKGNEDIESQQKLNTTNSHTEKINNLNKNAYKLEISANNEESFDFDDFYQLIIYPFGKAVYDDKIAVGDANSEYYKITSSDFIINTSDLEELNPIDFNSYREIETTANSIEFALNIFIGDIYSEFDESKISFSLVEKGTTSEVEVLDENIIINDDFLSESNYITITINGLNDGTEYEKLFVEYDDKLEDVLNGSLISTKILDSPIDKNSIEIENIDEESARISFGLVEDPKYDIDIENIYVTANEYEDVNLNQSLDDDEKSDFISRKWSKNDVENNLISSFNEENNKYELILKNLERDYIYSDIVIYPDGQEKHYTNYDGNIIITIPNSLMVDPNEGGILEVNNIEHNSFDIELIIQDDGVGGNIDDMFIDEDKNGIIIEDELLFPSQLQVFSNSEKLHISSEESLIVQRTTKNNFFNEDELSISYWDMKIHVDNLKPHKKYNNIQVVIGEFSLINFNDYQISEIKTKINMDNVILGSSITLGLIMLIIIIILLAMWLHRRRFVTEVQRDLVNDVVESHSTTRNAKKNKKNKILYDEINRTIENPNLKNKKVVKENLKKQKVKKSSEKIVTKDKKNNESSNKLSNNEKTDN